MFKIISVFSILLVCGVLKVNTLRCYVCDDCAHASHLTESQLQECDPTITTVPPGTTTTPGTTIPSSSTVPPSSTVPSTSSPSGTPGTSESPVSTGATSLTTDSSTSSSELPASESTASASPTGVDSTTPSSSSSSSSSSSDNPSSPSGATESSDTTSENSPSSSGTTESSDGPSSSSPVSSESSTNGNGDNHNGAEGGISVRRIRREELDAMNNNYILQERDNVTYYCFTLTYRGENNTDKVLRSCGNDSAVPYCRNLTAPIIACRFCDTDGCNSATPLKVTAFLLISIMFSFL